jgi:hypothetical protein
MAISSRSVRRAWVQLLRCARNTNRAFAKRLADEARMRRDMVPPGMCSEGFSLLAVYSPALVEPLLRTSEACQARPVSLELNDRS